MHPRRLGDLAKARAEFQIKSIGELRDLSVRMFEHAFESYEKYAFPWDELNPLTCTGRRRNHRGSIDDVLADYSLTVIDSLSTMAVMGKRSDFNRSVHYIGENVKFDKDFVVSVFELTIRALGGLLSAHDLASDQTLNLVDNYNGSLLSVAVDLGDRLMKAFDTRTGLPIHRVHLQNGIEHSEVRQTCTACAGTLLLEFHLLSQYTGNPKYRDAAKKAMDFLLNRLSGLSLPGSMIDVDTGDWTNREFGIGSGIDSFLEYTLKASIILDDAFMRTKFYKMYESILRHSRHKGFFQNINMDSGKPSGRHIDSLAAFWPGLQVLAGDVYNAEVSMRAYFQLWKNYGFIPETYNINNGGFAWGKGYPLRPELAESIYFLYLATNNTEYVEYARDMVTSIEVFTRTKCGYAAVSDVTSFQLEDKMDSYFLSETLKYLYLTFDLADSRKNKKKCDCSFTYDTESNWLWVSTQSKLTANCKRPDMADYIFTTEGHPIHVKHIFRNQTRPTKITNRGKSAKKTHIRKEKPIRPKFNRKIRENRSISRNKRKCPAFDRNHNLKYSSSKNLPNTISQEMETERASTFEQKFAINPPTATPNPTQIPMHEASFFLQVGEHKIALKGIRPEGLNVQIIDSTRIKVNDAYGNSVIVDTGLDLFQVVDHESSVIVMDDMSHDTMLQNMDATNAVFGQPLCISNLGTIDAQINLADVAPNLIPASQKVWNAEVRYSAPADACNPVENHRGVLGRILVINRGGCTFTTKARYAQAIGAVGVIIVNADPNVPLSIMSGEDKEEDIMIPLLMISAKDGEILDSMWQRNPNLRVGMITFNKCAK